MVTEVMVTQWSLRFAGVGLVLVGAGPPAKESQGSMQIGVEHFVILGVASSNMCLGL